MRQRHRKCFSFAALTGLHTFVIARAAGRNAERSMRNMRETRLQAMADEARRRRTTYGKLMAQTSPKEREKIEDRYVERRRRRARAADEKQ